MIRLLKRQKGFKRQEIFKWSILDKSFIREKIDKWVLIDGYTVSQLILGQY